MELLSATDIQYGFSPVIQVWKGSSLAWSRGFYWTGLGANNNWSTAANWSGYRAPIQYAYLQFAGTNRLSAYNDFTIDTPFNGITFDSSSATFTLSGNRFVFNSGEIKNNSTNIQIIRNDIKLSPTANTFNCNVGNITVIGILSGSGSLNKTGTATLTLNPISTNLHTGKTIISNGILETVGSNKISDSSSVDVAYNSIFRIGGTETVASIEGSGTVDMGANNLTISSANTATFVGLLSSSTGTFTKSGTGTQTLSSGNIGGVLTHTGGVLNISGNFTTSKDFTLCQGTALSPANANFTGNITQTNQGPQAGPRSFTIAQNANKAGTLTISGANVNLYAGLMIGDNNSTGSNGTLILNSGTFNTGLSNGTWFAGPSATIVVDSGTYTTTQMYIGGGGNATNNPSPISILTINNGIIDILGPWIGSAYTTNQANLMFGVATAGVSSTSTVNLNGGSLKLNQITGNTPAVGTTHTNTINFNGGTFDYDKGADRNLPATIPAGVTWNLIIKNGGAKISVYSGRTLTMAVPFSNDGGSGGLTKLGTGTLALGSLAHIYNGATDISVGTITVISSTATATFTNTTLTVNFSTPPSIGNTFKFFPASTVQTYATVSLIGASGRTASYNSTNSTLTIDS